MRRSELEHIIRAAGAIAGVKEIIILGSQSILGQFPFIGEKGIDSSLKAQIDVASNKFNPYRVLSVSVEADIMVPENEELADIIEGTIGELSHFHDTFGYYAQAVDSTTAKLPEKWMDRLVPIVNENTNGIKGLCLEIHDLMISKLFASREKDIEFFQAAVKLKIVDKDVLIERLDETMFEKSDIDRIKGLIHREFDE